MIKNIMGIVVYYRQKSEIKYSKGINRNVEMK